MDKKRDYYEVLGVSKHATEEEIKSVYRKKAKECHPDSNKTPEAEERFKELNEAHECLSDPEKRARYDRYGRAAFNNSYGNTSSDGYAYFDFSGMYGDMTGNLDGQAQYDAFSSVYGFENDDQGMKRG